MNTIPYFLIIKKLGIITEANKYMIIQKKIKFLYIFSH